MAKGTDNSKILREKIYAICDEMYAKGEKIRVRSILSQVEDVSSTSTIHKYYKEWREEQDANEQKVMNDLGFSKEFTRMFSAEIGRHTAEAKRRYLDSVEQAQEQTEAAIQDLTATEERLFRKEAVVEQLRGELSTAEKKIVSVTATSEVLVQELRDQLAELNKALSDGEKREDRLRTELAKVEVQRDMDNEQFEEAKKKLVEQTKLIADTQNSLNERNTQVATLTSNINSLNARIDSLLVDKDELKLTNNVLSEQVKTLTDSRLTDNQQLSSLTATTSSQVDKIKSLETRLKEQQELANKRESALELRLVSQQESANERQAELQSRLIEQQESANKRISELEEQHAIDVEAIKRLNDKGTTDN